MRAAGEGGACPPRFGAISRTCSIPPGWRTAPTNSPATCRLRTSAGWKLIRTLVGDPKIVLLDEPAGGMTPAETGEVALLIRDVIAPGRTCIVIEHKMDMIIALCARVTVLNFGHVIADGAARDVLSAPDVMEAYLGRSAAE